MMVLPPPCFIYVTVVTNTSRNAGRHLLCASVVAFLSCSCLILSVSAKTVSLTSDIFNLRLINFYVHRNVNQLCFFNKHNIHV